MIDFLKARRLALVPTLKCTLNCKLCCNFMQKFEKPYDVPTANILSDIDRIFEIFDHVEWIQVVGGEIFMHRGMAEVYEYMLKYKSKFDKLILMTNATIVPNEEEIKTLQKYKENCQVMISDYGKPSYKLAQMSDALTQNSIPYIIKSYHGDMQYYGGWIDSTNFDKFTGNDEDLREAVKACPQVGMANMHCLDGKLHICSNSCFMSELGVSTPNKGEFVDLNDSSVSHKEKRDIIRNFYINPVEACRICSFKNAENTQRFPAAEQVLRETNIV